MKIYPLSFSSFRQQKLQEGKIAFCGFPCSKDSFEIKNLYNIPCPVCNTIMIHPSEIENFKKEVKNETGDGLIEVLKKYKINYHPIEARIVGNIIAEAEKEPWNNISEIVSKEYTQVLNNRKKIQNSLYAIIDNVCGAQNISSSKIKKFYNRTILIANFEEKFDREEFAQFLQETVQEDEKALKRAMNILKKCPDDNIEYYEFLKKINNLSQEDIAYELLKNSLVTTEHIKTVSAGGENNSANYLAQCFKCNNTRGNKDFKEWVSLIPNFQKNITAYFKAVADGLRRGAFSNKYDTYLKDAAKTIETETQGKISIEIPSVINPDEPENKNVVMDFIKQLKSTKKELNREILQMQAKRDGLQQDEQYRDVILYCELLEKIQHLNTQKKELSAEYKNICQKIALYKQKQMELNEIKARIETMNLKHISKDIILKEERKGAEIENILMSSDINALQEKRESLQNKLLPVKAELDLIYTQICSIKIDKPDTIQKEIQILQNNLKELKEYIEKIEQLRNNLSNKENIIKKIKENEKKLAQLISLNQELDISSGNFSEIEKYEKLGLLLDRAGYIEKNYKRTRKYKKEKDDEVFRFVGQKIKDEMDELVQANPCILYKLNLDKISAITFTLKKLNLQLSEIKQKEKSLAELEEEKLKLPYQSIDEINGMIIEKEKILEAANIRFSASNIDFEIKAKEEKIAQIDDVLLKLCRKSITRKEFADIRTVFE